MPFAKGENLASNKYADYSKHSIGDLIAHIKYFEAAETERKKNENFPAFANSPERAFPGRRRWWRRRRKTGPVRPARRA